MANLLFENCAILDAERGELRPGASVRVESDRIVEVSERSTQRGETRRIDVSGRTLMPGLIDAHVHAVITTMNLAGMQRRPASLVALEAARILEGMLRRGFTTVRDAGGADWGLAQAVERGLVRGPRIFFSGRTLSQTGGHGDFRPTDDAPMLCACQIHSTGFSHVADGVDAVRKAAREELRRGAFQVKIMASGGVASPSDPIWNLQYSARGDAGDRRGGRRLAHLRDGARLHAGRDLPGDEGAGVRTIEHGNLIDEADGASMMVERAAPSSSRHWSPTTRSTSWAVKLGFPETSQRKVRDVLEAGLRLARDRASAADVPMGFGTDLLGETHEQQSREFRLRSRSAEPRERSCARRHASSTPRS